MMGEEEISPYIREEITSFVFTKKVYLHWRALGRAKHVWIPRHLVIHFLLCLTSLCDSRVFVLWLSTLHRSTTSCIWEKHLSNINATVSPSGVCGIDDPREASLPIVTCGTSPTPTSSEPHHGSHLSPLLITLSCIIHIQLSSFLLSTH